MKLIPLVLLVASVCPAAVWAADEVDYLKDVKPLLLKHCVRCHGPDKQKSGLRLDTAVALKKGGNSGPGFVPGKSSDSTLIHAVARLGGVQPMPPEGEPFSEAQVQLLRRWIDQGAKAPADEKPAASTTAGKHWAFQTPIRPTVPPIAHRKSQIANPIDAFILARLEKEGLQASSEADRATLIRRLSLDLLGLTPALADVEAFQKDTRPDAYDRLVERMLASPHYGERWGRHWLDLARYADSNGFNIDAPRSIWKYRDWVIDAFNRDLPFDQFVVHQLAGDLLPSATPDQRIATGFHRNTLLNQEGGIDHEQFRVESIVDRVNTTGAVFLGLTVGCCQCHDHKYDPLSQREYYQLFAFLNNCDEPVLEVPEPGQLEQRQKIRAQLVELEKPLKGLNTVTKESQLAWEKALRPEDKQTFPSEIQTILMLPDNGRTPRHEATLTAFYRGVVKIRYLLNAFGDRPGFLAAANVRAALTHVALEEQFNRLKAQEPEIVTTLVLAERREPRETYVHLGGDFLRKGVTVMPGTPAVLPALKAQGATRLDLARWLVAPENPLTARVAVNRFWQAFFGVGLVETDNDFGTQGSPPTHPELLDWLAAEFQARNWSAKEMHRLLVTSATYRQASTQRPELRTSDPRNRLLARQNRLRLEAETVRDAALSASGLLARRLGGPSVFPPQPDGLYRFTQIPRDWQASTGPDRYRRGMYTFFWRSAPHPSLTVFDAPDSTTTCTRRNRSNTPLQALTLLNDQAAFEFAQGLAGRVLSPECQNLDAAERLRVAFRLCLTREPKETELQRLGQFLQQQYTEYLADPEEARRVTPMLPAGASAPQFAAWVSVARVLLNLDEFVTRE